ncbi:MAG: ZIP family metal transporter [Clostridia bacterium]|nr:ZIP family metal transporter [Clostridia bacterium]
MALTVTFCAGLSILVGVLVTRITKNGSHVEFVEHMSVALALGALVALLIFDLIPELWEATEDAGKTFVAVNVVFGFSILGGLDRFIPDHHDTVENHDHENAAHIGIMASLALILHNIVEGMTVYTLSTSDLQQGIIFAVGIGLHNIPMGMLIYTTINGRRRGQKTFIILSVLVSTLAGGLLMDMISEYMTDQLICGLLCLATGMIVYIAFVELIPHVLRTKPLLHSAVAVCAGFLLVFLSCMLAGE